MASISEQSGKSRKKVNSMAVATILMMLGLLFSKASGFLRDIFIGQKFNELYRDSFTLAFTIPDLIYNLLIGGSIQSALTPSLSGWISKGEEKKGMHIVSIFITVMSVVMLVVCVLGVLFSEQFFAGYNFISDLISKLAGNAVTNHNSETVYLASQASKLLFPQIFFMMLAAFSIGILNAYKRFSSTAFGPTVYNFFVLLSIVFLAGNSQNKLMLCAAGVMGSAIIYFLYQFFIGFDKLSMIRFQFKPKDSEFKALLRRALPIMISASIVQINMVILNNFALTYPQGAVFGLRNASTVWQLPYGIFAVAVGNVMLPSLAALYEKKEYKEASNLLASRLRTALFMTVPSSVFVYVMSDDIIRAIYQWNPNSYTNDNVNLTSSFLKGYAIAIVIHTVVFIMNQAFYAIGKTKIPLLAGSICLITNPLLCLFFVTNGYGPFSLTITYSITSYIQMTVLCALYCRNKDLRPQGLLPFLIKTFGSAILGGIVVFFLYENTYDIILNSTKIKQLMFVGGYGLVFLGIYFVCSVLLKIDESKYWVDKIKRKVIKK